MKSYQSKLDVTLDAIRVDVNKKAAANEVFSSDHFIRREDDSPATYNGLITGLMDQLGARYRSYRVKVQKTSGELGIAVSVSYGM